MSCNFLVGPIAVGTADWRECKLSFDAQYQYEKPKKPFRLSIIILPIINMIIIIIFNSLKPWCGSSSKSYEMPGRDNTR